MQWRGGRRAWGAPTGNLRRSLRLLAAVVLAAGMAGCASHPDNSGGAGAAISGTTLAFESIDGPPPEVFRKLVTSLNDEASTRQLPVTSRANAATYRVRGYVSALVERGRTSFAWVWDIYDADKRRVLRLSGEEPAAAGKHRDAWAGADNDVLRKIARDGLEQVAAFLNGSAPPPAASPPATPASEPDGAAVLVARADSPEAAGIVRSRVTEDRSARQKTAAVIGAR